MKLDNLSTQQIMVYAELTTNQLDELDKYGMDATFCKEYEGISEEDTNEIHNELRIKMITIEETRIALVKEINRRMRRDLKIKFGPSDVQPFLNKFQTRFPLIGKPEAEVKAVIAQREKESTDAKLIKA